MIKINVVHIIIKVLVYTTISKNTHTHTVETGKRNKKKLLYGKKNILIIGRQTTLTTAKILYYLMWQKTLKYTHIAGKN